ncbi:MAG: hypothetical protein LBT08_08735 [Synergistaceae bacterium]|jgi:HPt (histidine-containing phosphotransfer) domain-containing protein|nr:hypothetical protein [Synergistaceae bacterium]
MSTLSKIAVAGTREQTKQGDGSPIVIDGVDVAKGILLTGGTEEQYRSVLELYCRDVDLKMISLNALWAKTNARNFSIQMNSLKTASATIGATEMSREAELMENAASGGDMKYICGHIRRFSEDLACLAWHIRALLYAHNKPEENIRPIDQTTVLRLKGALITEDVMTADSILFSLGKLAFDERTAEILSTISYLVLIAEFKEAAEKLDDLIS